MSVSNLGKNVVEKLVGFGESTLDRLSEISTINTEALKKISTAQADLAEGLVGIGTRQYELLGKIQEPKEMVRGTKELMEQFRGTLDTYVSGVRSVADEVRGGYQDLVRAAFEGTVA